MGTFCMLYQSTSRQLRQPRRNQKVLTRRTDTTADSKAHGDVATTENPTRQPYLRYRRPLAFPFCISNSHEQSDWLNSTCVHACVQRDWQTGKWTASIPAIFGLTRLRPAISHVLAGSYVPEKENTEIVSNSRSSRTGEEKAARVRRRGESREADERFGEQKAVCGKRQ